MKFAWMNWLPIVFCSGMVWASCGGNHTAQKEEMAADSTVDVLESIEVTAVDNRTCRDTLTVEPYDIPAQRFDETAQALCHASGCTVESDLTKTGSVKVNPVKGRMSILDALKTAIEGTDLRITGVTDHTIKIELAEK